MASLQEKCDAAELKASKLEKDVLEYQEKMEEEKSTRKVQLEKVETEQRAKERALKKLKKTSSELQGAKKARAGLEEKLSNVMAELATSKAAEKPNVALEHALRAQQAARKVLEDRAAALQSKLKKTNEIVERKKTEEDGALMAAQKAAAEHAAALEEANASLTVHSRELEQLREKSSQQEAQLEASRVKAAVLSQDCKAAQSKVLSLEKQLQEAHKALIRAEEVRRGMHEEVMTLKGNIRVFVRMRPRLKVLEDGEIGPTFVMPDGEVGGDHKTLIVHGAPKKSVDGLSEKSKSGASALIVFLARMHPKKICLRR